MHHHVTIGINGFGRIGRNALKIALSHSDTCKVVAVNDLTDAPTLAHLLKHDSTYGTFMADVSVEGDCIVVNGQKIKVYAQKDPTLIPWGEHGVDVVIESTGRFTDVESASAHIKAGAKRVVISAPGKGEVPSHVMGVNAPSGGDAVTSNASCTTNNITPVMAVLEREFGIDKAMMSTIHSYTQSQVLLDAPAKDLREARAAALSIVPTSTGAAIATTKSLPQLQGRFDGLSFRVPTPTVSCSDITAILKREVTVEEVNAALKKASEHHDLKGILGYTEEELVSVDYRGDSRSAVVDGKLTRVVGGTMVKIVCWYDNEWGYSNRLVEHVLHVGHNLHHH